MKPVIQIPDTSKGQSAMVFVKDVWFAIYYQDGKTLRKSLKTSSKKVAISLRNKFHQELLGLGATVYVGRKPVDKIVTKPDLYIYERPPYQFKVKGKVLCESWDRADVEKARDRYVFGE